MSDLTTKEKLDLVQKLTKKHGITAYEIGNKTELDTSAVHRILTNEVKKPRDRTLSIILEYIEDKIVGSKFGEGKKVEEEFIPYEKKHSYSIENHIARQVKEELKPIMSHITKEILQEIKNLDIKISRLRAIQEEILRTQELTQKGVESIDNKM